MGRSIPSPSLTSTVRLPCWATRSRPWRLVERSASIRCGTRSWMRYTSAPGSRDSIAWLGTPQCVGGCALEYCSRTRTASG
jgi:hypothetical protein